MPSRRTPAAPALIERTPTSLQSESWRLLWEEYVADPDAQAAASASERARAHALPAARALIERFLGSTIDLATLREELDRRTKADWRALALRGPSGAMVLNQLVKHADAAACEPLTHALRAALALPATPALAEPQLRTWLARATTIVPHAALAPGRLVAFVAACWHVQSPERWPAYQPSARAALSDGDALFTPTGDAVTDYLAFRHVFLALAATIGIGVAPLEQLCRTRRPADDEPFPGDDDVELAPMPRRRVVYRRPAHVSRVAERAPLYVATPKVVAKPAVERGKVPGHTQVQWQLAQLGRAAGCQVWIAANDHRRVWQGEPLGALSLPRLPRLGLDDESERLVRLIDVVWLSGRQRVVAAFEVERTTSIHSGILRMADLAALAPNLSFPMYVVAPKSRLAKVRRELARPSLQALGLHKRCGFFAAEALLESADAIVRWGGGADAIGRLAEFVGRST